ncbi:hypothetical protein [Synechococcus sp. CCY 9618]|uniref:hypothetical protein n=1 Tax=Synechococcus sp. CCY 9618 TaxID=2815602 RepID=UPI001C23DB03|nr:hypothetical protein [Synechococcus sp. CCY 9618]
MAEPAASDTAQRYAVIEQAYSREDWATVRRDGEGLLRQLRQAGNPQFLGLRMRLQLLLGHTQLYGFADKAEAARYYEAVARDSGEAALAKIAEQGLKQCVENEPAAPVPAPEPQVSPPEAVGQVVAPTSAPPFSGAAGGSPFAAPAPAAAAAAPPPTAVNQAAPWLSAAAAASPQTPAPAVTPVAPTGEEPAAPWSQESLIPEVVEEPELIELHQADPALAEELELTWKEPAPGPTVAKEPLKADDEELLSGLMLVRIG